MAHILSVSIDVKKLSKQRFIIGKNGAVYANLQIFVNDEKDQYGNNISVAEGQTKEERERKDKKNYIGNGRTIWEGSRPNPPVSADSSAYSGLGKSDDDLPF